MATRDTIKWTGLGFVGLFVLIFFWTQASGIHDLFSPLPRTGNIDPATYTPGVTGKFLLSRDRSQREAAMTAMRTAGRSVGDEDLRWAMNYASVALTDSLLVSPGLERAQFDAAIDLFVDCRARTEPWLVFCLKSKACRNNPPDLVRCTFAAKTLSRISSDYASAFTWAADELTLQSVNCEAFERASIQRSQ